MAKQILTLDANIIKPGNFHICYSNRGIQTIDYLEILNNTYVLQKKPFFKKTPVNLGQIESIVIEFKDLARTKLTYNTLQAQKMQLEVDVFNDRSELVDFIKSPENYRFVRPITITIPRSYHLCIENVLS